MLTLLAAEPRPWNEIPVVVLTGIVLGVLLLVAAIRAMFGKKK
jgi:hypothetical protein